MVFKANHTKTEFQIQIEIVDPRDIHMYINYLNYYYFYWISEIFTHYKKFLN